MAAVELRDRDTPATFLRRPPAVHAYELGDRDDFRADNLAAVRTDEKLGFVRAADHVEFVLSSRSMENGSER